MRKYNFGWVWAFLCLLSFMWTVQAADIVVKEEPVPANSFARVSIKLEKGQTVLWDVYPEPTVVEEAKTEDRSFLYFNGPAGKYKVVATVLTVKDGSIVADRQRKNLVLGAGPDPDVPVDPDVPPVPPDVGAATLYSKLLAAYKLDPANDRVAAPKLADLYSKYANETELSKYATWDKLEAAMRADAKEYGVAGNLVKVQTAVHDYLVTRIPGRTPESLSAPISPTDRKMAKAAFQAVSVALGKLK